MLSDSGSSSRLHTNGTLAFSAIHLLLACLLARWMDGSADELVDGWMQSSESSDNFPFYSAARKQPETMQLREREREKAKTENENAVAADED